MRIEETEEQTTVIFEQADISTDVYQTFDQLATFLAENDDAEEGSFIFDAHGVELEVTIRRT